MPMVTPLAPVRAASVAAPATSVRTRPIALANGVNTLDMLTNMLLQAYAEGRIERPVTVLRILPNTRIAECDFLMRATIRLSDRIICLGDNPLYDQLERMCSVEGTPFRRHPPYGELGDLIDHRSVLLRSHADVRHESSRMLNEAARENGQGVWAILGGCYPPQESIPLAYFTDARPDLADRLIVYAEGHRAPLASVGYRDSVVIGFPRLYPSWIETISRSEEAARWLAGKRGRTVSILTRGETADPGPQIMPNRRLHEILVAAIEELRSADPFCSIILKPHPLQDQSVLLEMTRRYENVTLSHEHPGVLAFVSDLVVTTWSCTILDALALGRPSIEFFIPNDYFLSVYPAGSAFRNLGIPAAESRYEFADVLRHVTAPDYVMPDVASLYEHEPDLSAFGPGGAL